MALIDSLLHEPAGSQRPVVACDMEGTLSSGVTWKGMRDYLILSGRGDAYNRFFRSRMIQLPLFRLGLINRQAFKESWLNGLLSLFAGMPEDEFAEASRWVVENELWANRRQPVIDELKRHRENGRRVVVVSGLIEPMLQLFVGKFEGEAIGTPLLFLGRVFSGRTDGPFTTGSQKVAQLTHFLDADGKIAAAYGDTGADIPMLRLSNSPTAVFPDKKLRRYALKSSWRIIE